MKIFDIPSTDFSRSCGSEKEVGTIYNEIFGLSGNLLINKDNYIAERKVCFI